MTSSNVSLRGVYTAAVFVSAFLIFLVQPMFGKMVLPLLGGSPAVWNTCMLFFQVALLAGYLYAHLSSRWLEPRPQWILHLALLGVALLSLPLSLGGAAPTADDAPVAWLLRVMLGAVGIPFVILAGTGPMLQRWFARSRHPDAARPYHLYAASNLGSMLALLAYPLLLEPRLRLAAQSRGWLMGFLVLGALIAACGAWGWARRGEAPATVVDEREPFDEAAGAVEDDRALGVWERVAWVLRAFVPSSLLLGVTTYISTDLTPAPLLWVLPLALYLLCFTLVFARRPPIPHSWMVVSQPAVVAALVIVLNRTEHIAQPAVSIPLHLLGLFITAMVAHGELARRRPPARHLTEFYLWLAVGGALGGVFNVLVAPVIFAQLWEYPIMLVAACLARPWPSWPPPLRQSLYAMLRAVAFGAMLAMLSTPSMVDEMSTWLYAAVAILTIYLLRVTLRTQPLWLALCIGIAVGARYVAVTEDPRLLFVDRSFYGQYRVNTSPGVHVLQHGSTLHGAQIRDPDRRREPLTYYLRNGPVGDIFTSFPDPAAARRVAVVGLGTGTTAVYASAGEEWTYYELDPGIERLARDTAYFTYLADSPARTRVVLGDARLSLEREEGRLYDLILLDAFSSDAIPVHLLTREAFAIYLSLLAPGGRIAVHVSNRYLDLEPVVAAAAREHGLVTRMRTGPQGGNDGYYENSSTWILVARSEADLGWVGQGGGWVPVPIPEGFRPWSDDYSSLWSVMRW